MQIPTLYKLLQYKYLLAEFYKEHRQNNDDKQLHKSSTPLREISSADKVASNAKNRSYESQREQHLAMHNIDT